MSIKIIGAALIVAACGGVGFSMAAAHRREEKALCQLIRGLDYMGCELQYRMTPLPELCRCAASECSGAVSQALQHLAAELESQIAPDAACCMNAALAKTNGLPPRAQESLRLLGSSLGRFDLQGQLTGLETVRKHCRRLLEDLSKDRDARLRSYQTLGLCAGSALAILFF